MTVNNTYVEFVYNPDTDRISFDISAGQLKSTYTIDNPSLIDIKEWKKLRDGKECTIFFRNGYTKMSSDGNIIIFSAKNVGNSMILSVPHNFCVNAITEYIELCEKKDEESDDMSDDGSI